MGEDVDLFADSDLSWSPGDGLYVLSGGDHGQVVIRQEGGGTWSATVLPARGAPQQLAAGLDAGYAQGMAEDWVRQVRAERLSDRAADWRGRPATERQLAALRRHGIAVREGLTCGETSALLDVALATSAMAPATPRQSWRLRRMGIAIPAGLTKREVSALITRGWRRRAG